MNSYDLLSLIFVFSLSISHFDLFSRFLVNVSTDQQSDLTLYDIILLFLSGLFGNLYMIRNFCSEQVINC